MASYYAGMDWSTFEPLTSPDAWRQSGRGVEAQEGRGKAWKAFEGGPDVWEAWLKGRLADAYEDSGEHGAGARPGMYKPWYRSQLRDLEDWKNKQAAILDRQRGTDAASQWEARFNQYNQQQDKRFSDFTSGNDQRWSDAMKQWNIEKTYNIGGQDMTTGQAFQHFLDSQSTTRGSIADMSSAWQSSVQGLNKQIGGVHESLQQQFAAQNAINQGYGPAPTQAQGVQSTMKGYRPYRGYSGTGAGFNRKGLRITNLNV